VDRIRLRTTREARQSLEQMFRSQPVERVSSDDLMSLASERGSTPIQVGAVLLLDMREGLDPGAVVEALDSRISAVPRLRQRLVKPPWGCGRPVWVDDQDFTMTNHLATVRCPDPGGEKAVLAVAAELLSTHLPPDRPLWAATLVTDIGRDEAALVVVFHHVLADGMGGLAVLGSLVDSAEQAHDSPSTQSPSTQSPSTQSPSTQGVSTQGVFPRRMPSHRQLAIDAAADRARSIRALPAQLRRLRGATSQLRPVAGMRPARSSLNKPTGPLRRFATVRVDLGPLRSAAHTQNATVNDVVLSSIAAALHRLLAIRGEQVDQFVISVPFSARRDASARDLGNQSGVIPLRVCGVGDPAHRLRSLAEITRAAKREQPAASNALLGPLFRGLARVGLYEWFINHQRLIHTFVSNLRGPQMRLSFLDCPIKGIIPLSMATGNVTVSFAILSYAGSLVITLIADPLTCPDLSQLQDALKEELTRTVPGP